MHTYIRTYTSRQAVVSHEAKKKQHVLASSDLRNHYNELFYTDGSSKFLELCSSAAVTAIA